MGFSRISADPQDLLRGIWGLSRNSAEIAGSCRVACEPAAGKPQADQLLPTSSRIVLCTCRHHTSLVTRMQYSGIGGSQRVLLAIADRQKTSTRSGNVVTVAYVVSHLAHALGHSGTIAIDADYTVHFPFVFKTRRQRRRKSHCDMLPFARFASAVTSCTFSIVCGPPKPNGTI